MEFSVLRKQHAATFVKTVLFSSTLLAGNILFSQTVDDTYPPTQTNSTKHKTAKSAPHKDATATQTRAADNTGVNKQDREKAAPTADQQKENGPDRETARKIRRAIVQDKSLSVYAHNVKVIVQGGKVTLKGPVRSEEEKTSVASKATEVAGDSNVDDQLTVAPSKHAKK